MDSNESSSNVLTDFCAVCGDKASKWRYSQYGATSCFSCRTFFRRSMESKSFKKYKCRAKSKPIENCLIDVQSRKKCAHCRFKKCRKVGMRHGQPHWVKTTTSSDLEDSDNPEAADASESASINTNVSSPASKEVEASTPASNASGTPSQTPSSPIDVDYQQFISTPKRKAETSPPINRRPPKKSYDMKNFDTPSDNRTVQQLVLNQNPEVATIDQDSFHKTTQLFEHLNVEFESSEIETSKQIRSVLEGPYHFQNNIPKLIPTPTFESGNHISSTFQADHNRHRPLEQHFHQLSPSDEVRGNSAVDDSFENQLDSRTRLLLDLESHRIPASRRIHEPQDYVRTEVGDQMEHSGPFLVDNLEEVRLEEPPLWEQPRNLDDDKVEHSQQLLAIPFQSEPKMCFTFEESLRIATLLQIDRNSMIAFKDTMKECSFDIIKQFFTSVMTGKPLNFSAMCWGYACGIQKLTRFALSMPEFCQVTENQNENKKCLMMHNIDPMFNIRNAFFFQADAPSIICQLERFGIFDLTLLKKISETFAFGRFPGVAAPMKWKQYFVTPWADSYEQEMKYEYLMSSLHELRLNHETTCLLSVVALFNTQDINQDQFTVPLDNVRREQYSFSLLLFRYLVHSRGQEEATRIYPSFMSTLEKLREMADILRNKTIKIGPSPNVEEHLNFFLEN